ncbi:MAG TPA: ATP-binding protein, partial [Anaerolineales bacterium]|nr:ATP-binding protein [Anaerolineales bacterium]
RANYEDIRQPCERLRTNLSQSGVSEEIAGLCELALQELLTNLVDHAYEGNLNGQITVRMASKNGQIFLQTEDTGLPARIKMEDVHMPNPEDLAEGGYGMAIIRSLMDDIRYESMQGKNIWTLIKNLK